MRVLHVVPSVGPRLGGPSIGTLGMCAALANRGLEVTLFTTDLTSRGSWIPFSNLRSSASGSSSSNSISQPGIHRFPATWPGRLAMSPRMGRELNHEMRKFDIVHIHCLYLFPGIVAAHYARKFRVPYVMQPHGSLNPYIYRRHRWRKTVMEVCFERKNLRSAAAIHYASEEEARQAHLGREQSNKFVVPLGVDVDEFANLPPRGTFAEWYPHLREKQLIAFIGRITPKKGLDLLIQAFFRVSAEFPDARLVIAGPDDEGHGRTVRALIAELGLTGLVTMTGMVEGRKRMALLADSDVWTLPSYDENFGIAVAEALASSRAIVISDHVNIHSIVSSAGAGIVTSCNAVELASGISLLLRDAGRRLQFGKAARDLAVSSFSWDVAAAKLERVYRYLTAAPGATSDSVLDLTLARSRHEKR